MICLPSQTLTLHVHVCTCTCMYYMYIHRYIQKLNLILRYTNTLTHSPPPLTSLSHHLLLHKSQWLELHVHTCTYIHTRIHIAIISRQSRGLGLGLGGWIDYDTFHLSHSHPRYRPTQSAPTDKVKDQR